MDESMKAPLSQHHPKTPGAGPEQLRLVAGIIALRGPVPSTKFMDAASPDTLARAASE
jgi:hypothetical protein